MKRKDCKPGTKVFVQGMVLPNPDPSSHSILVDLQTTSVGDCHEVLFSSEVLSPLEEVGEAEISFKRFFQKGDKVRFINQGRTLPKPCEYERIYTVTQSETESGIVYIDGYDLLNPRGFLYARLELVEPVETTYPLVFHEAVKYMMEGHIVERLSPISRAKFHVRMIEDHIQSRDGESTDDRDWCPCALDDEDVMSRWKLID